MEPIRCAIVDDEQPARELLKNFSKRVEGLSVIGTFKSPLAVFPLINSNEIDLLFLDIQMPDIKGTDFLKSIKNGPKVIFTTAYPDYALEGYDLNVTDYLLKPFSFERFLQAIEKVHRLIFPRVESVTNSKNHLSISSNHRIYRLKFSDILLIEGLKEYVSFYTKQGQRIISLQSLKALEKELPSNAFLRTHRSYIVQIDAIRFLEGNIIHLEDREIPIGVSYKQQVLEALK
ncbi:MAG: DNA-binding response regulator [Balneola sp.]|nr:MAG: DNA-binding response regulator [Balneola sp.]